MIKLNPHLTFKGQCEAAFRFYEKSLGGQITCLMTYGESPMAVAPDSDWNRKIVHATLTIGDQVLTGADSRPGEYRKPQGSYVLIHISSPADAERLFKILAKGGDVQLPIGETFWALRFGMLADKYGIPWIVNCGNPASPRKVKHSRGSVRSDHKTVTHSAGK